MRSRILPILSCLVVLCAGACFSGVVPRECRDFFELPTRERVARFRRVPIEKQVDLYLCGMNREPPESGYAVYISEGGDQVIPYLLERLNREPLEITQTRILDVFTILAVRGNLRGRQDVIIQVEEVVSKMKYGPMKTEAQRYVEFIKKEKDREK